MWGNWFRCQWCRARRGALGVSLLELSVVLPVLIIFISGIVDYGLALHRLERISTAVKEAARTVSAFSLEDDFNASPRTCPFAYQVYCNLASEADFGRINCDSVPNSLECLAIQTAADHLNRAGLYANSWDIRALTCATEEPPPPPGSVPPPNAQKAVKIEIKRAPGFKNCIWCYLGRLGVELERASAIFHLEGAC